MEDVRIFSRIIVVIMSPPHKMKPFDVGCGFHRSIVIGRENYLGGKYVIFFYTIFMFVIRFHTVFLSYSNRLGDNRLWFGVQYYFRHHRPTTYGRTNA